MRVPSHGFPEQPANVLLVSMIIHQLLNDMEKKNRIEKVNMVIGTFFSQTGTRLLAFFSEADPGLKNKRENKDGEDLRPLLLELICFIFFF